MKSLKHFAVSCALVLCCAALATAKPNLTGEWKMNLAKSEFGTVPPPNGVVQKITHNDPNLKIINTQSTQGGETTNESKYTTDGKECVNQGRLGQMTSTLKWDGDTLVVESRGEVQGGVLRLNDKWTLSPDGKVLTIQRHISGEMGDLDVKIVFEKQ